ncbi:MAG: hypothetical protein J0L84_13865 [Verrucomicrobia bacterium]|nr:hypothetical protein [Verrucomicrobiota bacterium]
MKCFCFNFRVVPDRGQGATADLQYANATVWVLGDVKEDARIKAQEFLTQTHWKFGREESVIATTVRQHPGSHRSGHKGASNAMHKHLRSVLQDLLRDGVAGDFYQVQRSASGP